MDAASKENTKNFSVKKTESQILAEVMDQTRKLGKFYMGKLQGIDVLKEFEVEEKKLNCVLWLLAHITWAEYNLLLVILDGPKLDTKWLSRFHFGSNASPKPDWPSLNEVMMAMEEVHQTAMKFLDSLDDEILNEPAYISFTNWNTDKRHAIMHAIRHEGIHIGHLSWLCKLHGIKTF